MAELTERLADAVMKVIEAEGRINRDDLIQACAGVLATEGRTKDKELDPRSVETAADYVLWIKRYQQARKLYEAEKAIAERACDPPAFISFDMFGGGRT